MSLHRTFMTGCLVAFLVGPAVAADKPETAFEPLAGVYLARGWSEHVDAGGPSSGTDTQRGEWRVTMTGRWPSGASDSALPSWSSCAGQVCMSRGGPV